MYKNHADNRSFHESVLMHGFSQCLAKVDFDLKKNCIDVAGL